MIDQAAEALIYFGNRALEQGNGSWRWLYEEGLAIWRVLDDAPCIADALERLRTLEGSSQSTMRAIAFERLHDTGTPAGGDAPGDGNRRCAQAAGRYSASAALARYSRVSSSPAL
jgi:hypothetical protein